MNFKLDENLPAEIADLLRQAGHDVKTVPEEGLGKTYGDALEMLTSGEVEVEDSKTVKNQPAEERLEKSRSLPPMSYGD